MFVIFKLIECYSFGDRNAMYLPQKPDPKNEIIMKKSESAYILSSQNHIKQGINNFDKKKISKSWVENTYNLFKCFLILISCNV